MASAAAFSAIRDYLVAQWATTPLAWDNEAFDRPEPPAAFVLVQVTGTSFAQASMGAGDRLSDRWMEEGVLLLSVIVPQGAGSQGARDIASALAGLFRGVALGDLEFGDMSIGLGVPAEDQGPWWLLPLRINWTKG